MSKLISIHLNGMWVLRHRDDDVLPIDFLKKLVEDEFSDTLTVKSAGLAFLVLCVKEGCDENVLKERIDRSFREKYQMATDDNALSVEIEDEDNTLTAEETAEVLAEKEKREAEEAKQAAASDLQKCKDALGLLIGADEFKTLSDELIKIAPYIIENKSFDVFSYQSYIFSINDGYGLTTYLGLLAALMEALKVRTFDSDPILEEKLGPPKGDSTDPFENARRALRYGKKNAVHVLCIDISEWINSTHTRVFKDFLMDVERHMSEFVVVFRVPFLDKEILEKLRYSLNDLMFVRTVSFAPFTQGEIQKYAKIEFERYGFQMSAAAWAGFHQRIAEEKSDGKFYGLNTIRKVVREQLYKKQLDNATRGKNDHCISKKDTLKLCANTQSIGMSGYEMLDRMVGGAYLKQRLTEIVSQIELARARPDVQAPCIHMRFVGNPGTGKTTVARILGKILKEKGLLRIGNFYEYAGRDFCGRYIGETAPKTASMCRDAYGSVLFIDEAYSLYRGDGNDRDYGREALDTLIAEMENHRTDLVVIMAGYTDEMETLMAGNAGLASRMPYVIDFPNFTREQLYEIFVSMLGRPFQYEKDLLPAVKTYFENLPDEILNAKSFSNARFVRNLFERTWAKATMRCQLNKISTVVLTKDDFERSIGDKEFKFIMKKKNKIGFIE